MEIQQLTVGGHDGVDMGHCITSVVLLLGTRVPQLLVNDSRGDNKTDFLIGG